MAFSELNVAWFRVINDLGKNQPGLNPIFEFTAVYTVFVLLIGLLYNWFNSRNKQRIMVINAGISFILAEIAGKLAGIFYTNHQPFAELANVNQLIEKSIGNSFPSDHTILFFSVCFSFWLVQKKQGSLWLVLAVGVAISRIGVGVHYPFDVIAGAFLAVVSALTVFWLAGKFNFSNQLLSLYEKGEKFILAANNPSKEG
jgi:undecaprenyl-diphosphatase